MTDSRFSALPICDENESASALLFSSRRLLEYPSLLSIFSIRTSFLSSFGIFVSQEKVTWGILKVTSYIRNKYGKTFNHKRVARVRRKYGLQAHKRKMWKKRIKGTENPVKTATRADEIWSYDFKQDRTIEERTARILVVCDEYSRECISLQAGRRFRSSQVIEALQQAQEWTGRKNLYLRSDNGPELRSEEIQT